MENNDSLQIFKYLKLFDNDKLSQLRGYDLLDLIILIGDYEMQLRNNLGVDKDITFGVEIECENASEEEIKNEMCLSFLDYDWNVVHDGSLQNGLEVVSPVLKDYDDNWLNLNKVCNILKMNAEIGEYSGGHVHIGAHILGDDRDKWLNFIKIWAIYENIIFRFTYGDFVTSRPIIKQYAKPLSKTLWKDYVKSLKVGYDLKDIIELVSHDRYQAINFDNIDVDEINKYNLDNTIEFRCPNGTLNSVIWQNNVNIFIKLLCYCKSSNFDNDIINKRMEIDKLKYSSLDLYDEIYLDQALELCDLIFTKNVDKIYFLKQYLKSFKTKGKNNSYILSKKK